MAPSVVLAVPSVVLAGHGGGGRGTVASAVRPLVGVVLLASVAYVAASVLVPGVVAVVGGKVVFLALVVPYYLVNLHGLLTQDGGGGPPGL